MFLGILLFVAAGKLLVVGVASTSQLIKTREYVFGLCIYYLGVDVNWMKIIITTCIWKLWWLVAVLFLHYAWDSCHTWQNWHKLITYNKVAHTCVCGRLLKLGTNNWYWWLVVGALHMIGSDCVCYGRRLVVNVLVVLTDQQFNWSRFKSDHLSCSLKDRHGSSIVSRQKIQQSRQYLNQSIQYCS